MSTRSLEKDLTDRTDNRVILSLFPYFDVYLLNKQAFRLGLFALAVFWPRKDATIFNSALKSIIAIALFLLTSYKILFKIYLSNVSGPFSYLFILLLHRESANF